MSKKREFGEGPLFTISNYIFWFVITNFYFTVCSLPFLIAISPVLLGVSKINEIPLLFVIIGLILEGPAITATYSVMGKIVREKDISKLTSQFFKSYKQNFVQSILIWGIQVVIIGILYFDMYIFSTKSYGLVITPIILGLMIIICIIGFYTLPIVSRFYFKTKQVIKIAFYYSIKKLPVTILNILVMVVAYYLVSYVPLSLAFIGSIVCFSIMYVSRNILKEIEDQVTENSGEKETKETIDTEEVVFIDESRLPKKDDKKNR